MKKIEIKAFAKINLTLDVKGLLPNGYHQVEMIMQQISLCDIVTMQWTADRAGSGPEIVLTTNRPYLPTDERNLAYKAALEMNKRFGPFGGRLEIDIRKRIPVAAGLAGGSSNGAAVLHGLNVLWDLNLSVSELCEAGSSLGSDVPFCIMGQAAAEESLKERFADDPMACHCALATGTGTELKPVKGLVSDLVLSKPPISVSTASVYKGIDAIQIKKHPDTEAMIRALEEGSKEQAIKSMVNVLENYTLIEYPNVMYTKNNMQTFCGKDRVLMSGSGPTVFAICDSHAEARNVCREMKKLNKESFWAETTR